MTPDEAGMILSYCTEAWPSMKVGEETAIVWADALAGISAQDAYAAVRQLAKTDDFAPSLARVIHAARGVAKGHDEYRALPSPQGDRRQSARAMAALNALYAQVDRPAHDHRKGREACPSCSTAADRLTVFAHDAADLLGDYGVTIDAERAARYAINGYPA